LSTLALILVLGSAVVHAIWNLIYKSARNKDAFAFLKAAGSSVILTGAAAWAVTQHQPEPGMWLRAILSGFAYAAFFVALSASYRAGDFSLAYPVGRGTGLVLTAAGGVLLLHESLSTVGVVGIALILIAVAGLSVLTTDRTEADKLELRPVFLAILVGVTISVYSINDKCVQLPVSASMTERAARSILFLWAGGGLSSVLLALHVGMLGQWRELRTTWREGPHRVILASCFDSLGYSLFLLALSLAGSKTAYISPLRSVSVVIGAILGAVFLREGRPVLRLIAAVIVFAGVVLISQAGG
jgi:drug/metabolite transporter (DMT)-like permease